MPAVGQIVNYVLPADSKMPGEIRPAIVIRVWTEETVNLQVFVDGPNDYPAYVESGGQSIGVHWKPSVSYNADYQPGTWHYWGIELPGIVEETKPEQE